MYLTDQTLIGKRILFISPKFFGYENKIKAKMESMGAKVTYYDERSIQSAQSKALLKISSKTFYFRTKNYYENIIKENKNVNFDYVFIVKAEMITKEILEALRKTFKTAKFCLYLWDSVSNIKGIERKFKYFDKVLTFDRKDADSNQIMKFRPLFFVDEFINEEEKNIFKYDLSFIGTIHSDRYKVIKDVMAICKYQGWNTHFFCYLQSKFMYKFYKLLKSEFKESTIEDFAFNQMETKKISDIVNLSKVVLDINHPKQTGLTMRTIEMIGMGKKLITTNENILEYDFYNPDNILVIDRNSVEIPSEFIEKKYKPIDKKIFDSYSLESWIKVILLDEADHS